MDRDFFSPAAASPDATAVPSETPTPEVEETPQVNWDADDNPWKSRAAEQEAQIRQREAQIAEREAAFNRQFAEQARAAEIQRRNQLQAQFENGDIDARTYSAKLNEAIEQVETTYQKQFEQALRPYLAKEYAEALGRQMGLNSAELEELKQAPPESMPWAAQSLLQRRNYVPADRVSQLESQLDQLQRSLAAGQVVQSGVTQTLSGNPSATGQQPQTSQEKLRSFLQQHSPDLYRRTG